MKSESLAEIFNSAQIKFEETASHKCFYTFNSEDSQNEGRRSFGELKFFNNVFLAPLESITYKHEENTRIIILPIAGALNYHTEIYEEELVRSEQIKIIEIEKELPYTFNNPFEKEWINYLHIGLKVNSFPSKQQSALRNIEFRKMDELVCFDSNSADQSTGYIGIYQGRSEDNYMLKNPNNGVFVYVISGAFEVQGRLLEYKDGLSLWNTNEIEFEALSNNAIILILEIKLN